MLHRGENKRKTKTQKNEWSTPPEIFDPLNEAFDFVLDAAASKNNALCPKFYTKEDDGLKQPWASSTFCNPPFADGGHVEWIDKAIAEKDNGNNSVLIVPNGWGNLNFEAALNEADYIVFPYRRIQYVGEDGQQHSVNFHSLILVFSQFFIGSAQEYQLRKIGRIVPAFELRRRGMW